MNKDKNNYEFESTDRYSTPKEVTEDSFEESNIKLESELIRHLHILLVEDSKMNQVAVQSMLKGMGHSVVTADDGERALDLYHEKRFDLVLMDIQMPKMDGIQTTKKIRELDKIMKISTPVAALTASEINDIIDNMKNAGIDYFITKPLKKDELVNIIKKVNTKDITKDNYAYKEEIINKIKSK